MNESARGFMIKNIKLEPKSTMRPATKKDIEEFKKWLTRCK